MRKVLIFELSANLAVAAIKAVVGLSIGALAVLADALHSVVDAAGSVVGITAISMSKAPADREHPYGHLKIEMVAAAAIGLLIGGVGLRLLVSVVDALRSGSAPVSPGPGGYGLMATVLVVNIVVAAVEQRAARRLGSELLSADAAHTASDVLVTCTVIASLVASGLGVPLVDAIAALLVVLLILRLSWSILRRNVAVLIDRAPLDAERVRAVALEVDGVASCHRVRSAGPAQNARADLHIHLDPELSLREAHDLSHQVEERLRQEFPELVDVTIHVEPWDDVEESL